MADSVIERIATILNTTPDEFGSEYIASLILEAMRTPTEAMVISGASMFPEEDATVAAATTWQIMIDGALSE